MRAFILLTLVSIVCADKLGYNYRPVGHSDSGLSFQPGGQHGVSSGTGSSGIGGSIGGLSGGAGGASGAGGIGGGAASGFGGLGFNSGGSESDGIQLINLGGAGNNGGVGAASRPDATVHYDAPAQAEYEKEFFIFNAPEHEFDDSQNQERVANSLKKNLRVIFIKGPENTGLENAVVNLAKHAAEQRTAIYVLNKQADLSSLVNKFNAANNVNAQKPEVHFVKYRTPEDAANAQKAIQSQYDNLSGPSQSHNGGVAPVLNFASSQQVHTPTPKAPGHAYLPASIFRRL